MPSTRTDDLIINVRGQMRWYQRLVTDVCTAVMWGGWLYLWRPLLSLLAWLHGWRLIMHPTRHSVDAGLISWEGMLALAVTAGMLMLWSLLPARRVQARPAVTTAAECAEYFELPEAQINAGREASVCVVHHDEAGRIVRIERRG